MEIFKGNAFQFVIKDEAMKNVFKMIVVGLCAFAFNGAAVAADKGSADEAMAMVKKGVAFVKSV